MAEEEKKELTMKQLKDNLEEVLLNGTRIPVLKKLCVDEDQARAWFKAFADNLPKSLQAANKIVAEEQSILSEARNEANRTLADARMKAEKTISDAEQQAANAQEAAEEAVRAMEEKAQQEYESAIAQAQSEAKQIIAEAQQEAARLVSQQEVLRQARVEAQELTDRTRAELEEKHNASLEYLNGLFEETDRFVSSQLTDLRAKRNELNRVR